MLVNYVISVLKSASYWGQRGRDNFFDSKQENLSANALKACNIRSRAKTLKGTVKCVHIYMIMLSAYTQLIYCILENALKCHRHQN